MQTDFNFEQNLAFKFIATLKTEGLFISYEPEQILNYSSPSAHGESGFQKKKKPST